MIQFNLLPDVKREYEKARRVKRLTFIVAGLSACVALLILGFMFSAHLLLKKHSSDLSADIKSESQKLQGSEDINKILTIQNQLKSLTGLHDQKPVATRLLEYLKQITPAKVTVASLDTNFDVALNTMTITGSADSLGTVNQFVDTLKFTTYKTITENEADAKTGNAFSAVVLTNFSKGAGSGGRTVPYTITLQFDPIIFASNNEVALVVPAGKITTRSATEKPESIFDTPADQPGGQGGQ